MAQFTSKMSKYTHHNANYQLLCPSYSFGSIGVFAMAPKPVIYIKKYLSVHKYNYFMHLVSKYYINPNRTVHRTSNDNKLYFITIGSIFPVKFIIMWSINTIFTLFSEYIFRTSFYVQN